ncbi:apolipoprotein Eb-like [Cololabis saira]|uniref:apolipoprotein Eb-like n=1 Tax=Cololabis saira TaxID=129043 RepID=UPI002AD23BBA|nr:apolipoprotein Eb-like [Cololabis saira]
MKVFAVILALAVFSGCQARSIAPEEWRSTLEDTVDKLKEYMTDMNTRAEEVVKDIRSHQISRELDTLFQDSVAEMSMYKDDLHTKLAPYTQEATERLGRDLQRMAGKLGEHMTDARQQMDLYGQELRTMVELNTDDVRNRLSAYSRKLNKRILKDTEEMKRVVGDYFSELHSRSSDHAEDLRARLDPYFAQVRVNAQAKMTTINDLLKSQMETVKGQIQTAAEDIKERFEDTTEDLTSALGGQMETLRNWFQPYITQIRESM